MYFVIIMHDSSRRQTNSTKNEPRVKSTFFTQWKRSQAWKSKSKCLLSSCRKLNRTLHCYIILPNSASNNDDEMSIHCLMLISSSLCCMCADNRNLINGISNRKGHERTWFRNTNILPEVIELSLNGAKCFSRNFSPKTHIFMTIFFIGSLSFTSSPCFCFFRLLLLRRNRR